MQPEQDFVYWRHVLPIGIKIEEVSCGARYSDPKVWQSLAYQIYCENGREGYREIDHFDNGAPFLQHEDTRISISHTPGLLVVATLPPTPETPLNNFSPRTAMGVDVESLRRDGVLRVRERYMNPRELELAAPDDLEANITVWTAKEALYKAAMTEGLDCRNDIDVKSLPLPMTVKKGADGKPLFEYTLGTATLNIGGEPQEMNLFCYDSEGCRVTVAFSPECAKSQKKK